MTLLPDLPVLTVAELGGDFRRVTEQQRIPVIATFELTYRCNFDCVHCYVVQPGTAGELSTAEVKRILEELRDVGTLYLTFTGGEALTRPDFAELYVHAKELGFLVSVFTNAALVRERHLALFAEYPPARIEVTLYGASEATYTAVTQRRHMHAHVLERVDHMLARGLPVKLKAVAISDNKDELGQLHEEALKRGDTSFRFDAEITKRIDCRRGPEDTRISAAEVVAQDRVIPGRPEQYRRLYEQSRGAVFPSDRSFLCGAGRNAVMIDPFGQLQLCGTYRVDAFDLRQGTVADGWRSLLEVIERPPERPSRCLPCDKRRLCGSCAGTNVLENGHRDEPSDYHCEITHARVEAFCADLRPEPSTARALPLHRARPCARPWLDERRPLLPGHLAILERRSRLRDVPPAQVAPPTRRLPLAAAR